MPVVSGSGSTLHVSAALPASYTVPGYEALTWTKVSEVTGDMSYGREYEMIDHAPIDTRIIQSIKGNYREGSFEIVMGSVPADAGQVILFAASTDDDDISFKITRTDGAIDYVTGKVTSFKPNVSGGSILNITANVVFNTAIVQDI